MKRMLMGVVLALMVLTFSFPALAKNNKKEHNYNNTNGNMVDFSQTNTVNPVPEPSTALLLLAGLAGVVGVSRRLKKK